MCYTGCIVTSAGISAGMDMSLHVIGREFGTARRDEIARRNEYTATLEADCDPFGALMA